MLQEQSRDLHVSEADRSDRESTFDKFDVIVNVDCLDVIHRSLAERRFSLAEGHPDQVVGADLKAIRQREAMVYGYKSEVRTVCAVIGLLDQDVTGIAVEIQKS